MHVFECPYLARADIEGLNQNGRCQPEAGLGAETLNFRSWL